jgi:hypothetical protein
LYFRFCICIYFATQLGHPSTGGDLLGAAQVSRVQGLNAVGIALLGAAGKAAVVRAKANAVDGFSVEYDSILCCGGVTSVCDILVKGGDARGMLFAECDACGERAWLVLRTATAILKPVSQVR